MTRDPIRRRFGFGAARLAIGHPTASERLSERARTQIVLERRLILVPVATLAAISWLLASAWSIPRPGALETEILVDAWTNPPIVVASESPRAKPEPDSELKPQRSRAAVPASAAHSRATRDALVARRRPTDRTDPLAPREESSARPAPREFDVTALATHGASWTPTADLRHESTATADPTSALRPRPDADSRGSGASAAEPSALAQAASGGTRSRREALAALESEGIASRGRASGRAHGRSAAGGPGAAASEQRPSVSASRPGPALFDITSSGGELGGWQEVPLEALPDCDPPGRQDLLKKRILLAAAGGRECSHASGSFRFVETRNLGAFLMWSRPNPAALAGQPRDRDACDVLERALACLGVQ